MFHRREKGRKDGRKIKQRQKTVKVKERETKGDERKGGEEKERKTQ